MTTKQTPLTEERFVQYDGWEKSQFRDWKHISKGFYNWDLQLVLHRYRISFDWQQPVWKKVYAEAAELFGNNYELEAHFHAVIKRNYLNAFTTGTPETAFPYLLAAVNWVQEQKNKTA